MDVRMPRMTGYEACRALKEMDDVKDIPVVFLSAKGRMWNETGLEPGDRLHPEAVCSGRADSPGGGDSARPGSEHEPD